MPLLFPNLLPLNIMQLISLKIVSLSCFCNCKRENKGAQRSPNSTPWNLQRCDLARPQGPCSTYAVADLSWITQEGPQDSGEPMGWERRPWRQRPEQPALETGRLTSQDDLQANWFSSGVYRGNTDCSSPRL